VGNSLLALVGVLPIAVYLMGVLIASVVSGDRKSAILLLIVFPTMHIPWGCGYLLSRSKA